MAKKRSGVEVGVGYLRLTAYLEKNLKNVIQDELDATNVGKEAGKDFSKGMSDGIKSGSKGVAEDAFNGASRSASREGSTAGKGFMSSVKNAMRGGPDAKGLFGKVRDQADNEGKATGNKFTSGISSAMGKAKSFGDKVFDSAKRNASKDGKEAGEKFHRGLEAPLSKTKALVGGLFAGAVISGAAKGFNDLTDLASDYNETLSKSNTIWGTNAKAVEAWANDSVKNLGLSKAEALDATASYGNMFQQIGIAGDKTLKMSKDYMKAAADLGSFHNASTQEVTEALMAAQRGEYDSLQRFIPTINAAKVQEQALTETHKKSAKELTDAEKAMATYTLVMKGMGAAAGDWAKTNSQMAGSQKQLNAQIINLKTEMGKALLPVKAFLVFGASQLLMWAQKQGPAFERVKKALSPVGTALTEVRGSVRAFIAAWKDANGDVTSDGLPGLAEMLANKLRPAFDLAASAVSTFYKVASGKSDGKTGALSIEWYTKISKAARGFRDGLIDLGKGLTQVKDAASVFFKVFQGKSDGKMGALSPETYKSVSEAARKMRDVWNGLSDVFKTKVVPVLASLWEMLKDVGGWLLDHKSIIIDVGKDIVVVGGSILGVVFAVKKVIDTFNALKLAVMSIKAGFMALRLLMAANPFTLILMGLTALIVGLMQAYKRSETFRNIVNGVFNAVKSVALGVFNWFTQTALPGFTSFFKGVGEKADQFKSTVSSAWNSIKSNTSTVFNSIKAFFVGIFNVYKTIFLSVFNVFKAIFTVGFNAIKAVVVFAFNFIKGYISATFTVIQFIFGVACLALGGIVSKAWNSIKAVTLSVWNWIKGYLTQAFNAIKALATTAFNAVKNVITTVWNAVKGVTLTVWNFIRGYLVQVLNAIKSVFSSVTTTLKNTVSSAWNWISSITSRVWNGISGFFSRFWASISGLFTRLTNTLKTTISNAWNAISGTTKRVWDGISGYFGRLKGTLEGKVRDMVNGMTRIWDNIKGAFEKPVRWVVDNVLNKLIEGWNAVIKHIDAKKVIAKIAFSTGGQVPKYVANPNRHSILARASGGVIPGKPAIGYDDRWGLIDGQEPIRVGSGEYIVNAKVTQKARPLLDALNFGGVEHMVDMLDHVRGFFKGGLVRAFATGGRVRVGGKWLDNDTWAKIQRAQGMLGWAMSITQGSWSTGVKASAGTHNGAGVADLGVGGRSWDAAVAALRAAGLIAWHRTPAQGFSHHIHLVNPAMARSGMAPGAVNQVASFLAGRNGLGRRGGKDDGPRGTVAMLAKLAGDLKGAAGGTGFSLNPIDWLKSMGGKAASWMLDKASGVIDSINGKFGNTGVSQMLTGLSKNMLTSIKTWLESQAPAGDGMAMSDLSAASGDQVGNARIIADVGKKLGFGRNGIKVALMTALQESGLRNISHGDRDSVGLFQQRPSQGWGSVAQIMNPSYSASKFFSGLRGVPGWEGMAPTVAAQRVQRSAFPSAYARWDSKAESILRTLGLATGGMVPKPTLYDTGGVLKPGTHLIENKTGKPEYILNAKDTERLLSGGGKGGSMVNIEKIETHDSTEVVDELNFWVEHAQFSRSNRFATNNA